MTSDKHVVRSPWHGEIYVTDHARQTFKVHVWRTPVGGLHFTFRHPNPNVTKAAQPILDRLNELIPFDVDDLMVVG